MDEEGSVEASVIHEKSTALSTEFKEFAEDDDEDHDDLLELAWHCWVSGEKHMNTARRDIATSLIIILSLSLFGFFCFPVTYLVCLLFNGLSTRPVYQPKPNSRSVSRSLCSERGKHDAESKSRRQTRAGFRI